VLDPRISRELVNEYVQRWPRWSIFVARALRDKPPELLPPGERSYTTLILTSFSESLKNLRMTMNSDDPQSWSWKRIHKVDFLEPTKHLGFASSLAPLITPGPLGVGGDQDCINACNIDLSRTPWLLQATTGPSERMVIDMSDQDKFYQNLTLGQSEHVLSNYRTDQQRSWLTVEPHAVAFSDKQVKFQMQHTLVLSNTYQ
jgi:acyl-homoserine lactone acylase PvdQ